ncbi:MAG: alpha/beta fold hydrolase [Paracoccaceae bacterium]
MQIKANGIFLEVETHGPEYGTPLILIRGQGSQLTHWPAELVDGFVACGYRVVLFDNRDVGLSQRCPHPECPGNAQDILDLIRAGGALPHAYTLDDMANDVVGLMDALEIQRAHMFGISMGGAILQLLAINHPERLLSATIVMTACRPFLARLPDDPQAMEKLAANLLVAPRSRAEYLDGQVEEHANWGSPGYPMPEAEIRAMAALCYDRGVDDEGMNRQVLTIADANDRRPALRELSLPCQVIHGSDDTLVVPELGREIADHIPNCAYHEIAGMGHIITPALSPLMVSMVDGFVRPKG